MTDLPTTERRRFPGISSRAWEHPAARAALQSVRRVPGFDLVLRKVFGVFSERALRLVTQGSAVEVGPDQYPRIEALYAEVLAILDAPVRYPLYVAQTPVVNAGAVGMDQPFIVLDATTLAPLGDDQLRVVLAHEVAHVLSGHVLYKTLLRILLRAGPGLSVTSVPLSGVPYLAVVAALLEWDRKSELSADRCALLVAQDPEPVHETLLRLAGGVAAGASTAAFRRQSKAYHEPGGVFDSAIKLLALLGRRHPFPVQRVLELDRWIDSGDYQTILDGAYPRREDDPVDGAVAAWRESVSSYAEGWKASTDPFAEALKDVGERLSGAFRRKGKGDPTV
jgi:Zn-dependent protease with chaperone function